ncbi:MAG: hypothetical protein LBQ64_02380 [Bacteroidales bacterium]|jgi:hypothetical protein|nr:hypothetical protein [Bacteroidales bacterium]
MNRNVLALSLFLVGLCLFSCDKYESEIAGTATYLDSTDNTTYPAAGAIITKRAVKGDTSHPMGAVIANENGDFLFNYTTKGSWFLEGKLTKDSLIYTGVSEPFTTNGTDKINCDIKLYLLITEEDTLP